jgi:hypothetical protein
MPNATQAYHNRLAVIFDFDQTLAANSDHALLRKYGLDPEVFNQERVQTLAADGWDPTLAGFYCLISESKAYPERPITREFLAQVGRE